MGPRSRPRANRAAGGNRRRHRHRGLPRHPRDRVRTALRQVRPPYREALHLRSERAGRDRLRTSHRDRADPRPVGLHTACRAGPRGGRDSSRRCRPLTLMRSPTVLRYGWDDGKGLSHRGRRSQAPRPRGREVTGLREAFRRDVRRLGLEASSSCGNFVFVRFPEDDPLSAGAASEALRSAGIIVRPTTG